MAHVFETWFRFMKNEMHEDTAIRFGRMRSVQSIDWFHADHSVRDGAGGFLDALDQLGFTCPMPTARKRGRLSRECLRGWKHEQIKGYLDTKLRWRPELMISGLASDHSRVGNLEGFHTSMPTQAEAGGIAWQELPSSLVQELERLAADQSVSLNSLLTWAVARHLVPWFQQVDHDKPIHIGGAANIRPPGNQNRANHSVQYTVLVNAIDGPRQVHEQVKQILRSQSLFVMNQFYRTVGMLPNSLLTHLFRKDASCGKLYQPISHALFSNLGHWNIPGESAPWLFLPCSFFRQPLVIGMAAVNRRFVIAIKLHPSTGITRSNVELAIPDFIAWLSRFVEEAK